MGEIGLIRCREPVVPKQTHPAFRFIRLEISRFVVVVVFPPKKKKDLGRDTTNVELIQYLKLFGMNVSGLHCIFEENVSTEKSSEPGG